MRKKAFAVIVGVVLCLGLLAGCSSSDDSKAPEAGGSEPAALPEDDVSTQDGVVEQMEGAMIATPFYTVTIPDEFSEGVEWKYNAEESSMGPDDQWEDDGALWLGHHLSVSLNGEAPKATFFVVASRVNDAGDYVAVQGGFALVKAGEVTVGDHTWAVSVCKGWNPDDPGDSSGEIQAAVDEYATWVKVGFDPNRVTDDAIMDGFLESYVGREWTAQ